MLTSQGLSEGSLRTGNGMVWWDFREKEWKEGWKRGRREGRRERVSFDSNGSTLVLSTLMEERKQGRENPKPDLPQSVQNLETSLQFRSLLWSSVHHLGLVLLPASTIIWVLSQKFVVCWVYLVGVD